MNLFFHLTIHVLLALLAGFIVWRLWQEPIAAFLSAVLGGVLIDLDHLAEYFWLLGFNFKLDDFVLGIQYTSNNKFYLLFHGWEYVMIIVFLAAIIKNHTVKSACLALALGMFFHLSIDVMVNHIPAKSYSIIYRVKNDFVLERLVPIAEIRKLEITEIGN